ncbi:MAG: division/cell wall cluster transcriptional repressor MraZ [Prevotella sp.]|nr:division/cell wall cluster transcriptional repressor MraZ [Prevotella sp.]
MRFIGTIEAKIDAKGRAFLPAPFRKEMQATGKLTLYLRKDIFEECLVLYPENVWNERVDALNRRLSLWNRGHQRIMREFMSDVEEITLDANGRFLISKRYLEMAGINADVKFIGKNDIIEIWSCEKTQEPFMDPEDFAQALEAVMGMDTQLPDVGSSNAAK